MRSRRPLGAAGGWAAASIPILLYLTVPMALLFVAREPGGVGASLASQQAQQAIALSLETSLASLVVIVAFGTPLAILIARYRFRGREWLDSLVDLPIVLPPAVAGIALLATFGRSGPLGPFLERLGIDVVFTPVAVVMAQAFVASPYFVRAAISGLSAASEDVVSAAALEGAGPLRIVRSALAPAAATSLLGGATMAWSRALGEFGATLLFAGNLQGRTQTMPLAIYLGFESGSGAPISLSILILCVAFGTLALTRWLACRRWSDEPE